MGGRDADSFATLRNDKGERGMTKVRCGIARFIERVDDGAFNDQGEKQIPFGNDKQRQSGV